MLRLFFIIIFLAFGNFVKSGEMKEHQEDPVLRDYKQMFLEASPDEQKKIIDDLKRKNQMSETILNACERRLKNLSYEARSSQVSEEKNEQRLKEINHLNTTCNRVQNRLSLNQYILSGLEKYLKDLADF